jgi:hypothetical protein
MKHFWLLFIWMDIKQTYQMVKGNDKTSGLEAGDNET